MPIPLFVNLYCINETFSTLVTAFGMGAIIVNDRFENNAWQVAKTLNTIISIQTLYLYVWFLFKRHSVNLNFNYLHFSST